MIKQTAAAKLNLYLHVGPVRADRLHDLCSLFVFTEDGDELSFSPARELSLQIEGPFAGALAGEPVEGNLIMRAARGLQALTGCEKGAAVVLDKRLPVAAGIGGGSADAAAALRGLVQLWGLEIHPAALARLAFSLGADVPACLAERPVNVGGAGEIITRGPRLTPLWTCLINPLEPVPTGPVFREFDQEAALSGVKAPQFHEAAALCSYSDVTTLFSETRNDLQKPAIKLCGAVADILHFLSKTSGCMAARMSGSGATCFGLYGSRQAAMRAAARGRSYGWWTMATAIYGV